MHWGRWPGAYSKDMAPHHTPDFYIDENGMKTGVRALASLAIDYMLGWSGD